MASMTSRRTMSLAALVLLATVSLTSCRGGSTTTPPAGGPSTLNGPTVTITPGTTTAAAATTTTAAAGGFAACAVVTESMIATILGTDPGAGVAPDPQTCDYKSQDGTSLVIVVQTTTQPDVYLPASFYSATTVQGATALTSGVDRGYYKGPGPDDHNGTYLVVKGGKGVLVVIFINGAYTGGNVLALANATAAKL
jgi:hypothetical protein